MTWEGVVPEIKEKYEGQEISLLLGNGFTQAVVEAYCRSVSEEEGRKLKSLYDQKSIVEAILSLPGDEWKISEPLEKREDIRTIEELLAKVSDQSWRNEIKNRFLEYLFKVNENFLRKFSDEILGKYEKFFEPFGNFFTLNYDVVLYRLLMVLYLKNEKEKKQKIKDGFPWCRDLRSCYDGNLRFCDDGNEAGNYNWLPVPWQHVFYLHGAFHLLCNSNGCIIKAKAKHNTNGEKGKFLMEAIQELKKTYQWFILLEESAEKKRTDIQNNRYLKHCFDKFRSIHGVLVTYGVRFGKSDQHIFDAIVNNRNLEAIYVGCHSEDEKERLERNFKEAFEQLKQKEKEKRMTLLDISLPKIQYFSTKQNPFV